MCIRDSPWLVFVERRLGTISIEIELCGNQKSQKTAKINAHHLGAPILSLISLRRQNKVDWRVAKRM